MGGGNPKSPLTRPPVIRRVIPVGMNLIGHCKDCRGWEFPFKGCPIVIMKETSDEEHMAPPDFGCVRWKAKENDDETRTETETASK